MPGTYREIVCLKSATPPITLYGTSADASQTVIVNNNNAGKVYTNPVTGAPPNPCASSTLPAVGATYGTSFSATFAAYAKDFQAKNLTIANDFDETGMTSNLQAVALMTQADRLVFENVRLLGNQDTLYTKTNNIDTVMRVYLKGCYVEGDVDFIFGRATTVLDTCEVKYISTRRGGSNGGDLISPSTDTRNSYGMLVANGTFTADSGTAAGTVALGRAWDEGQMLATYPPTGVAGYPNGQLLIRDSVLGGHVSNSAPWVAAASTSRPFSATAGTYPANRLWELNNSGDGAAH
jgi:pectinesterase